jgi:predicted AAA+ superfamily ATPase
MEILFEKSYQKVERVSTSFIRSLSDDIRWDNCLTGIRGARGVGKTTLLLQRLKQMPKDNASLYASLDDIWFSEHKLIHFVEHFAKRGGTHLFLDEVHKYPNWSQELKNAYDDYPGLKIVFTGSSLLEILNSRADLSRRAVVYEMQGLSFREYLNMSLSENFPVYGLEDILKHHRDISTEILQKVKPLQYFSHYLESGYYPFSFEMKDLYYSQLEETINLILEIELPLLRGVDISYVPRLKQLLLVIAESAPFAPNVQKLSERIGINRNTLLSYLHYLQEANLTTHLYRSSYGMSKLQKPDKIFLENTNMAYMLAKHHANEGNVRETFFFNQLGYRNQVEYPEKGDFLVNKKYLFEIGGKGKNQRQIHSLTDAYIVSDDIEYGYENKIPLWQFGFLH